MRTRIVITGLNSQTMERIPVSERQDDVSEALDAAIEEYRTRFPTAPQYQYMIQVVGHA